MNEPRFIDDAIRELVREEIHAALAKTVAPQLATYVTIPDYAKARSISISTVRSAIRAGRLPAMKIGTAIRVRSDVEIGASVIPTATNPGPSPAKRAEELLARRHGIKPVGA